MVAQLLRLKLQLLANSFRRSVWQIIGLVIGLLYGVGVAVAVTVGLAGLRLVDAALAGSIVTVSGAVVVLGFVLLPLVFGSEDVLDPRRFSLFGIGTSRLAAGLAVAALVSIPTLAIAMIALAQVATWSRGAGPVLLSLLGVPLIVATCTLAARVSSSIAAFLLSTRRARDTTGVVGVLLLLLLSPAFVLLTEVNWRRDGIGVLDAVAQVAGWTPLGAVWAVPADAANGRPLEAFVKLVIALGTLGLLWVGWRYLVQLMLTTPQREAQAKEYGGLGWFRIFPATPAGVIAARSLTYWGRDARYHVSLLVIPVVPFIMILPLLVAGVPAHYLALLPVPVVALFLGWSIHNDAAFDNTAIWLHLSAQTRGVSDRLGRVIPPLLVGVPLLVLGSVVSARVHGDSSVLPSLVGVSLCILFCGLGLSSIMSARFPYPAVRPGDSPFAQPQSGGTAAALIQSLSFGATFLLSLPTLALAAIGLFEGGDWHLASLGLGTVMGLAVLAAGIGWGGRVFDRRAPELLAFSMRN